MGHERIQELWQNKKDIKGFMNSPWEITNEDGTVKSTIPVWQLLGIICLISCSVLVFLAIMGGILYFFIKLKKPEEKKRPPGIEIKDNMTNNKTDGEKKDKKNE